MSQRKWSEFRSAFLAFVGFCAATAFVAGAVFSYGNPQSERVIEDKIPKHVPIKVKLKTEKEKAVKDLNNTNWPSDFALEVTNTSNKPIYFLELWLELPETLKADGGRDGFALRFGRMDFIHFDTRPEPTDVPIQPGSTYTFEIPEKFQKGWEQHRQREKQSHPTKLDITFEQLSFGDGSGFIYINGTPYPFKRDEQSSTGPCREGPAKNQSNVRTPAAFIVPVNFFVDRSSDSDSPAFTQPDLCCPGTGCQFKKDTNYICACNSDARSVSPASCNDPEGHCAESTDRFFNTWCEDLQVGCPEYRLIPCGADP